MQLMHSIVGSVTFDKETYNVSENGTLQIVLILSKPSSSIVTIEVFNTDITATGEHTVID